MTCSPRYRLYCLAAALLIALSSVVSAARMLPAPPADAALTAWLASGGDAADLCGEAGDRHDHDCPYCRLLSDPPSTGPAARAARLCRASTGPVRAHLTDRPAPRSRSILVHAPPRQG